MSAAYFENAGDDFVGRSLGMRARRPRVLGQSGGAVAFETRDPFVADAALNAVAATEFGETVLSSLVLSDELHAFVHGVGFFPGH